MKSAIEQSVKEKIKVLAREQDATFSELWRNLILERFLARLAGSYLRKIKAKKGVIKLPESIEKVILTINKWLNQNQIY